MNDKPHSNSYLSPKLEVRPLPQKGGYGVFAVRPVEHGEVISVWSGRIVNYDQWLALPPDLQTHTVQVEEDLYLASLTPDEPPDFINHSCNPNAGMNGQLVLVAMRNIAAGDEVCFDYAMCDGTPYDEFECQCGSPHCRRWITGNDWLRPELWERYDGYFIPYLQRRIERAKAAMTEGREELVMPIVNKNNDRQRNGAEYYRATYNGKRGQK